MIRNIVYDLRYPWKDRKLIAKLLQYLLVRVNSHDDEVDRATMFRPIIPRDDSSNHLTPNGRFQLPPLENRSVNKLRTSSSFGDIKSESDRQKDKPRLRKSNAVVEDHAPVPKVKELRSLSITVPPNSYDVVSHLVSPLPTHKAQFRHTESIQRYDDEVKL